MKKFFCVFIMLSLLFLNACSVKNDNNIVKTPEIIKENDCDADSELADEKGRKDIVEPIISKIDLLYSFQDIADGNCEGITCNKSFICEEGKCIFEASSSLKYYFANVNYNFRFEKLRLNVKLANFCKSGKNYFSVSEKTFETSLFEEKIKDESNNNLVIEIEYSKVEGGFILSFCGGCSCENKCNIETTYVEIKSVEFCGAEIK